MPKYRNKPIEIEAIQVTYEDINDQASNFAGDAHIFGRDDKHYIKSSLCKVNLYPGDYIVKWSNGEFYVMGEEMFEQTYEEVTADGN